MRGNSFFFLMERPASISGRKCEGECLISEKMLFLVSLKPFHHLA